MRGFEAHCSMETISQITISSLNGVTNIYSSYTRSTTIMQKTPFFYKSYTDFMLIYMCLMFYFRKKAFIKHALNPLVLALIHCLWEALSTRWNAFQKTLAFSLTARHACTLQSNVWRTLHIDKCTKLSSSINECLIKGIRTTERSRLLKVSSRTFVWDDI